MNTLLSTIRLAEKELYSLSSAVNTVVITESIYGNSLSYNFRFVNAKVGDVLMNDDHTTSLVVHVITKDKRILKRGNHICPHQSQILGRDLHGETIASNRGKSCFCYFSMDAVTNKKHPSSPYMIVVYAPGLPATNWTAFRTVAELTNFVAAYGLKLSIPSESQLAAKNESVNEHSFTIDIPEKVTFLPLTYSNAS